MSNIDVTRKVYTVSEITRSIKRTLEGRADFSGIWIQGEIYNLTFHSSGHIYFTLKDDDAVIAAVFFRNANRHLTFKPREGMSVLAQGGITVYEKRGSYQLNVTALKEEGIGDLQRRIELLKKKLLAENLFDPARKRPLPFLPRRIGIATSPTGAAVRDIIKVALRRFPGIGIVVAPAQVQGDGAAESISTAIEELNRPEHRVDVIIAGRGGGSFEDLMPFSEEIVVRAFAASRVPIISAVGHQVDHPLCDDAADLAAPTPSAAAEMAVPEKVELSGEVEYHTLRIAKSVASLLVGLGARIVSIIERRIFRDPYEITNRKAQYLSDCEGRVLAALKEKVSRGRGRLLTVPDVGLLIRSFVERRAHAFSLAVAALEQLSPLAVIGRGYAIITDEKDHLVRSVNDTSVGRLITLMMRDGSLSCGVQSITAGGFNGKKESGQGKGRP